MSSDQVDAESGTVEEPGTTAEETGLGPDWSVVNWGVIVLFTALTLLGIALSVGWLRSVVAVPDGATDSGLVTVPLYVYLYSGFGALGYVFTKLMVELDEYTEWSELEQLVSMALRIPAAWVLATGIYLFLGEFAGAAGTDGARFAAGVAFLVGLYVNVALKALGSLADRILGRGAPTPDEDGQDGQ